MVMVRDEGNGLAERVNSVAIEQKKVSGIQDSLNNIGIEIADLENSLTILLGKFEFAAIPVTVSAETKGVDPYGPGTPSELNQTLLAYIDKLKNIHLHIADMNRRCEL